MKNERIVRRTTAHRHKDKTDWARVRAMTEAEVDRGAAKDPDNPPWTDAELRNAQLVIPSGETKLPLSIRLDREVVRYFKEQGPGYQSRIGAVLLSYVRSQEAAVEVTSRAPGKKRTAPPKRGNAKS